jgi:hypothetical protein
MHCVFTKYDIIQQLEYSQKRTDFRIVSVPEDVAE